MRGGKGQRQISTSKISECTISLPLLLGVWEANSDADDWDDVEAESNSVANTKSTSKALKKLTENSIGLKCICLRNIW